MNKEIKIIDLLNKKANREEMPNKIKYENIEWYYDIEENEYIKENEDYWLFQDYFPNNLNFMDCLNDLVEVLEDKPKIHPIFLNEECGIEMIEAICDKLNEIIEFLNKKGR